MPRTIRALSTALALLLATILADGAVTPAGAQETGWTSVRLAGGPAYELAVTPVLKPAKPYDILTQSVLAAGTEVDRQRRATRLETARAYHGAVLAGRSLPHLLAMRAAYGDIVADRRASFDEGTVTRQAVLDADASLASIESKIVAAREARSSALEALAALTGLAAFPGHEAFTA